MPNPGRREKLRACRAINLVLLVLLLTGVAWGEEENNKAADNPSVQGRAGEEEVGDAGAVRQEVLAALKKVNTVSAGKSRRRSGGVQSSASPVVKVEPGRNISLTVAGDQLNRIVTPFTNPMVYSVSKAKINVDGSVIYLSIAQADGPTTMFITETGESDPSLSLTLVPQDITPREIRLVLEGGSAGPAGGPVTAVSGNSKALKWEQGQPYTRAIEKVLLSTARGEIPQGYSFHNPVPPEVPRPRCRMGVQVEPRQVMEGHNFLVVVSRLTNITSGPLLVDESSCYHEGVRAVAVWPNIRLQPRQSTELYTVYQRGKTQKPGRRPNVIGAASPEEAR